MGIFVYVIKYNFMIIVYATVFITHTLIIKSSYTFTMREHNILNKSNNLLRFSNRYASHFCGFLFFQ